MRFRTRREAVAWAAVLPLAWVIWCSIPSSSPFVNGWPWTPFGGRANYWLRYGDSRTAKNLRTGETIRAPHDLLDREITDNWVESETTDGGRWMTNNRTGERRYVRTGQQSPTSSITESWTSQFNREEQRGAWVVRLLIFAGGLVICSAIGCWLVAFLPGRPRKSRRSRREAIQRPVIRI